MDDILRLAGTVYVKKIVVRDLVRIARDAVQFMKAERKFQSADITLEYSEHPHAQQLTDFTKLLIEYFGQERKIRFDLKDSPEKRKRCNPIIGVTPYPT